MLRRRRVPIEWGGRSARVIDTRAFLEGRAPMIQVWHYHLDVTRTPAFPEDYDHVATVDSDSLEYVVERTQASTGSVTARSDVRLEGVRVECRSTQVGDVLVSPDGTVFRLGPFGLGEVTDGRIAVPTEAVRERPRGVGHIAWAPLQPR
jgi:hypothetical protein